MSTADGLTRTERVGIDQLHLGDIVRFNGDTEWVEVVKVTRDRMGFDLLYTPFNQESRWRGFDEGDKVDRKVANDLG